MDTLPPLPLVDWKDTQATLHRWAQIVGKVRLALAPERRHWWHVSLRASPRGIASRAIPWRDRAFEAEFDLVGHGLDLRTSDGDVARIPFHDGLSVAEFHRRFFAQLGEWGIKPKIKAVPYDLQPKTPFAKDAEHASYDLEAVERYRRVLGWSAETLEEFAGRFAGKTSPVHLFWHAFDIALTRFSGRRAPKDPSYGALEREAYSHEVASFGFWVGDAQTPFPAFYAYARPVPPTLAKQRLTPAAAKWRFPEAGLAVLPYDAVRKSRDPRRTVLGFFEGVYQAARKTADWDAVDGS